MSFFNNTRTQTREFLRSLSPSQFVWTGGTLLFILFRLWLIRDAVGDPSARLFVDSKQYLNLAQGLIENGRYEDPTGQLIDLFRSPGYAGFLAILLVFSRNSLSAVVVFQLALNLTSAFLLYVLGKELGRPRVGVASALIFLASPNSLFWSVTILSETVFALGLVLCLLLILRSFRGAFPAWGVGILLALLAYIRPIGLYLIPIWAGIIYIATVSRISKVNALKSALSCLLAGAIVIAPWYVRNAAKHDQPVFATVSRTTIQSYHMGLTIADATGVSWEDAKIEAFELSGSLLSVLNLAARYPASFLNVQLKGVLRTSLGLEIPTWEKLISGFDYPAYGLMENALKGKVADLMSDFRSILQAGDYGFLTLLIWGMGYNLLLFVGCFRGLMKIRPVRDRELRVLLLLVAITVAYLAIAPGAAGQARFRVPIEPLLAFVAGLAFLGIKAASPSTIGEIGLDN